jgi:ppGpp synthetase/RelA/SpoT-type nucleotidyltranferase
MASLDFDKEKSDFRDYYNNNITRFANAVDSYRTVFSLLLSDRDQFQTPVVEGRVKDREECIQKFSRKYQKACEESKCDYIIKDYISDLIGIRIICHYESDVQHIRQLISENFTIIEETNKSSSIETHEDTFGYKGLHLDVKLKDDRERLPEYRRIADLKFEVQVRTIIQDAWSVLDHKIKYKKTVPHQIKRRINRLAALFELADQEFEHIYKETHTLEQHVKSAASIPKINSSSSEPIDAFNFLEMVTPHFPGYDFEPRKIDGFVQELIEVNQSIQTSDIKTALIEFGQKLVDYKTYQQATYLNRLNPYTTIRHALYLKDKQLYSALLFDLQRNNFDTWLSINQ